MKLQIELEPIILDDRIINSAGNCPNCGSHVEYQGLKPITDGELKGLGFKGHKGVCVSCKSEFSITRG